LGIEIAAYLLVLASGLLIARDLFLPGTLLSGDNVTHLAEIQALYQKILPEQSWWSGWYEGDFAGYPLLVYQYPLGKWMVALAAMIPGIEIVWAYKIILFFSWLLPVLVIIRMLARRGYAFPVILVVSLLYLSCFDSLLFSLAGMWNQYLSAGIFLIALGSILKMMEAGTARQLLLASFWTSLAAVSHQAMLILLPLAWIALLSARFTRPETSAGNLKHLFLLPLFSFSFAAWYFIPILMTWNWPVFEVYPMKWYSLCSSLFPIVSSDLLRTDGLSPCFDPLTLKYSLGMVAALILGAAGIFSILRSRRKGRRADLLLYVAAGISAGIIGFIILVLWEPFPFLRNSVYSVGGGRLALYLFLPMLLLSAAALEPSPGPGRFRPALPFLAALLLLPNLAWAAVSPEFPLHQVIYAGNVADTGPGELADINQAFTWLKENTDPGEGRILYQDTVYNFKDHDLYWSHILSMGYLRTGLWSLGASGQLWFPTDPLTRTQGLSIFGRLRSEMTPEALQEDMALYNCRWAMTCEPELEDLFRRCPGMDQVFNRGMFTIFRAREKGAWAEITEGAGSTRMERGTEARRELMVNVTSPDGAAVLVRSSYHPWWKAFSGDGELPVERGLPDQLLRIRIPEAGQFRILLEFRPPKLLPLLLTLPALLAAILITAGGFRPNRSRS